MIDSPYKKLKNPEDVFTPRASKVNLSMYVPRADYERHLVLALRTGYHFIIYGDSGCGKSWLYKKVFGDKKIDYITLDLNTATTGDDVDLLILENLSTIEPWIEESKVEDISGNLAPGGVGVKANRETEYRKINQTPFINLVRSLHA